MNQVHVPTIEEIPTPGFYYHCKHNPEGEFNNYVYEVVGIARDSETKEYGVLYRPLYENTYMGPASYSVRPFSMFVENVEINGVHIPRFKQISDREIIEKLKVIRNQMYT